MQNVLGGLNYDAKLAAQDWKAGRDMTEQAILLRFLLSMGSPPNATPQSGIADSLDPSQVSSTDVSRPLLVRISSIDALQLQVNPGFAVTQTGAIMQVLVNAQFPLARTQAGDINVIFVENRLIPGGTQPVNDYLEDLNTLEIQDPNFLTAALLTDWQNTSLFPASRKQNIVVLAIVSVVATAGSGLELQIDQSQSIYPYNRPWFSVRAVRHESQVGSGAVTNENPHGTTFNNLSIDGTVGLFQGLSDTGLVVSRDRPVNKMLGSNSCSESIPLTRIQIDSTGITSKSVYGGIGAQYVSLLNYPIRLGSVYETTTQQNSIAAEVIQQTNILVLGPHEVIQNPLTVEYNAAQALQPPVNTASNLLVFSQPFTQELIVSGGLTIATIPNPNMDMEGSGPYPRRYRIYMLSDSSLARFPQILNPSARLDNLGSGLITPAEQPIAPARVSVGLTKALNVSGMQVQVQISGQDVTGANIQETVTISNAAGYADESVPSTNYDSPNQIYQTLQLFATVQSIQVLTRVNDGPLSEIQVWSEAEPGTAPTLNDITKAALIGWNGQGVSLIEDARVVSRGFFKPDYFQIPALGDSALDAARLISNLTNPALLSGSSQHLVTEDFEDLHYFDTVRGIFAFIPATGSIVVGTNSLIQAGDQYTIAPSKVLTATTAAADPTLGQFQIGPDGGATAVNIVSTVNNVVFNSGVLAALGTGTSVDLTYTAQAGASGNGFTITRNVANSASVQVSGFSRGFDEYSESYLDRSVTGLRSLVIPQDSDLYAFGLQFRGRYRSRAIAIPVGIATSSKFCLVLHGHDRFFGQSIRIRGSDQSNPSQWLGWQVMTQAAPGSGQVYLATLPQVCHKVQLELYGKMRGFSLFDIVPNP